MLLVAFIVFSLGAVAYGGISGKILVVSTITVYLLFKRGLVKRFIVFLAKKGVKKAGELKTAVKERNEAPAPSQRDLLDINSKKETRKALIEKWGARFDGFEWEYMNPNNAEEIAFSFKAKNHRLMEYESYVYFKDEKGKNSRVSHVVAVNQATGKQRIFQGVKVPKKQVPAEILYTYYDQLISEKEKRVWLTDKATVCFSEGSALIDIVEFNDGKKANKRERGIFAKVLKEKAGFKTATLLKNGLIEVTMEPLMREPEEGEIIAYEEPEGEFVLLN